MNKINYEEKNIQTEEGVRIHYNLLGFQDKLYKNTQNKPVLVFLHGLGGDLDAWNLVRTQFLTKGYLSLAIDLRGHGISSRPKKNEAYSLNNLAEDVFKVINFEKLSNVVLIGHCLGGMVAQKIAIKNDPKISKIVLIATSCNPVKLLKKLKISTTLEKLAKLFENYLSQVHKNGRISHQKFMKTGDFNLLRVLNDIKHTSINSYGQILTKINTFDISAELKKIKPEVLILVGTKDKIFPIKSSQEIAKLIPNSKLLKVGEADHMIIFNHYDEIVTYIAEFI
ncbi:MAG: alpha/beta hydrolase [Pseudomonadales bacterium]|nr:alpha/beta hydrolase [Pseudomonadales bacterium]